MDTTIEAADPGALDAMERDLQARLAALEQQHAEAVRPIREALAAIEARRQREHARGSA